MVKEKEKQTLNPDHMQNTTDSISIAIDRLLRNATYRRAFVSDPVGTLERLGVKVTQEQKLQVQYASPMETPLNFNYNQSPQLQQTQLEQAKSVLQGIQAFQQALMNTQAGISVEELQFTDKFASAVDRLLTSTELRQEFDQDPVGVLNRLGVVFLDEARGKEAVRLLQESLRNSKQSLSPEDIHLAMFPRVAVWVAIRPLPHPGNFPFPQTTVLTQTGVYTRTFF